MGSRVCDIKKKFEGLGETSKDKIPLGLQVSPPKSNNSTCFSGQIHFPSQVSTPSTTLTPGGIKGNIKRSHAFRSDRTNRIISSNETSESQPAPHLKKINHTNRPINNSKRDIIKVDTINSNKTIFSNSNSNRSNYSVNNKKGFNINQTIPKPFLNDKSTKYDPETQLVLNTPVEYSIIQKDSRHPKSSKVLMQTSTNSNEISFIPSSKETNTEPIKIGRSPHSTNKTTTEKNVSKINESTLELQLTTHTPKKSSTDSRVRAVEGAFDNNSLSNTLKKVLSSPLPSGPPPKKPPRTFAHSVEMNTDTYDHTRLKPENSLHSNDDISLNLSRNENNIKPIVRPLRSKTESQIMLKKLEVALQKHKQQGKIIKPKVDKSNDNLKEEHNPAESSNLEGNKRSKKQEQSLPDTPKDKSDFNSSGCFGAGLLSCSNSMDLVRSSHIYDVPFESKSQFYLKELKEMPSLSSFVGESSSPTSKSMLRPNTLDYGKINHLDQFSKTPIYAKPNIDAKSKSLAKNLRATSVSEIVKNINLNELEKCGKDKQLSKQHDLHYMSSPIVEKVSFLPNAPPLSKSPEKASSTQKKFLGKNSSKSFPSRSCSLDFENAVLKNNSNRSFSLDLSHPGDKEFHIDNEKIQMIVNEAYNKCLTMPQDSDSESVASTPEDTGSKPLPTSPEVVQKEREQRTAERKTYLKRVCSRAKSFHHASVSYPRLFEYLLLIGLDLNPSSCKVPYIKAKYPQDAVVPRGIEQLCFPDASDWPPQACGDESGVSSCYCIVITHATGTRKYGYCRRVQPEGAPICLPLAYCIVSPYKANCYFAQVLAELESRHGQPEQLLANFIHQLYQSPFPAPGQGIHITNPHTSDKSEILTRKLDPRQDEMDIARLLNMVRFSVFLQLFGTLLLERKVILLSYSISKLSTCIEGLCASLYPFHWQHTIVPIVPSTMLDLCQAPTPYVIGLLKPREARGQLPLSFSNIDQVLIVDVDESRIVQSCGDESLVLPTRLCRGLRDALACAVPDKGVLLSPSHNLIASEALITLFVQLVGHYRDHIITSATTGQRQFQRDSFVKSITSNTVQSFLDWFTETTMFTGFIESRIDRSVDPYGLFEQRCVEHLAQQQASTSKSYRSNINKTVKSFGVRFKEWTNST